MTGSDASSGLARIVGLNIRTRRVALGLKQRDLSEILDVDVMAVSNWERGIYQPSMPNLVAVARALKCDVAWLFTEHEANGDTTPTEAAA